MSVEGGFQEKYLKKIKFFSQLKKNEKWKMKKVKNACSFQALALEWSKYNSI